MFTVVMVCTGNICRSPMAAGLLQHRLPRDLKDSIVISSAGTHALHGQSASRHAITTMQEKGIDIRNHRARQLSKNIIRDADLIVTMEIAQLAMARQLLYFRRPQIRLLSSFGPDTIDGDITDPYGSPLEAYQTCIQVLLPCIDGLINWLSPRMMADGLNF